MYSHRQYGHIGVLIKSLILLFNYLQGGTLRHLHHQLHVWVRLSCSVELSVQMLISAWVLLLASPQQESAILTLVACLLISCTNRTPLVVCFLITIIYWYSLYTLLAHVSHCGSIMESIELRQDTLGVYLISGDLSLGMSKVILHNILYCHLSEIIVFLYLLQFKIIRKSLHRYSLLTQSRMTTVLAGIIPLLIHSEQLPHAVTVIRIWLSPSNLTVLLASRHDWMSALRSFMYSS